MQRFSLSATYATPSGNKGSRTKIMAAADIGQAMSIFRTAIQRGGNSKIDIHAWPIDETKEIRSHD